jgi:hypothetical protein
LSYVPGFKFDAFVSYAHRDDELLFGRRWVSASISDIESFVKSELGRDHQPYFDRRSLEGNHDIAGILDQVKSSAVLIVVLSNAYLESEFCLNELQTFLDERGQAAIDSVFVVRKSKLDESYEEPGALYRVNGYQFWGLDEDHHPYTYGLTSATDERYCKRVTSIGTAIAQQLRRLRARAEADALAKAPPVTSPPPQVDDQPTALLAEATDDLDDERETARSFFEQQGIRVLPLAARNYSRPGFAAEFEADLKQCTAFVQLLSGLRGQRLEEAPRGLPWLQYERARAAGLSIYQWRSRALEDGARRIEDSQQQLLEMAEKRPLQEFLPDVARLIKTRTVDRPITPSSVYIDHDRRDEVLARRLQEILSGAFDWDVARTPFEEEEDASLQTARDTLMLEYESVVFLYGETKPSWIDRELNRFRRIKAMRTHPPHRQIIFVAPPDKPDPTVMLRGRTDIVDGRAGVSDGVVEELKNKLAA